MVTVEQKRKLSIHMRITAYLKIADGESDVLVKTGDVEQRLSIAAKPEGNGLGVNGG